MKCGLCQRDFNPFKVRYNGHEIDSEHCLECREKKKEELDKYPPQHKRKDE